MQERSLSASRAHASRGKDKVARDFAPFDCAQGRRDDTLSVGQSVAVVPGFRTRTTMRPSEWNSPPVAVLAVVSASGGVT